MGLVLKDGDEVGDDAGSAVDRLAGGADVGEGCAEDGGGAVELALEEGTGGEEAGDGGGVVVEEEGHDVGVDGPEGLGDGELPPAVGDGEDDGFLRNGYEPVADGHVVILDRRTGETVELRYYYFGQKNSRDSRFSYLLTISCCSCTPVKNNAYFFGQENSRDSRCFGLSLICRHFRSPVAPVLLSKTMRIFPDRRTVETVDVLACL